MNGETEQRPEQFLSLAAELRDHIMDGYEDKVTLNLAEIYLILDAALWIKDNHPFS